MNAVVAAITRMGDALCVGAVAKQDGALLRLIPKGSEKFHCWTHFDAVVGDCIELTGSNASKIEAPHREDYVVDQWRKTGNSVENMASWLRERCSVWVGGRDSIFDGHLGFSANGKGFLERAGPDSLPKQSVGLWELPAPLVLQSDKKLYKLESNPVVTVKYVGIEHALPQKLPAGTLVRLSLARWWEPDDGGMPERCWLQLSGWY